MDHHPRKYHTDALGLSTYDMEADCENNKLPYISGYPANTESSKLEAIMLKSFLVAPNVFCKPGCDLALVSLKQNVGLAI